MKKIKDYLLEFAVIFISISVAFLSENWREQLQEKEDYQLILEEIHANLRLDSIERLLDQENPCPEDSLEFHFISFMYSYRWPDVKSTGIGQLRNSKNLDPSSALISEINNYYTWTEYLKESTPYQYIMPQTDFNEWFIENELDPSRYDFKQQDTDMSRQLTLRLKHLKRIKELQGGIYSSGLSRIVRVLELFDAME